MFGGDASESGYDELYRDSLSVPLLACFADTCCVELNFDDNTDYSS